MPLIRVRLFGPLAEQHGRGEISVEIKPDSTALDVIRELGLDSWLDSGLRCALDQQFCDLSSELAGSDELALLPPVSGG